MNIGLFEAAIIASVVVPIVVFVVVLGKLLAAPVGPGRVSEFLTGAGLPADDPHARDLVTGFLIKTRRHRAAGTVFGAGVGALVAVPTGAVAGAMAGFLVGSLAAATADPAGRTGHRRVAALTPRTVGDYVPRRHLFAVRAVALAASGLALAGAVLPAHHAAVVRADWPLWLSVTGIAVLVVAVTETASRHVVVRRQQVSSQLDVRLDDAIRSASARAVVGAGLGLALLTCAIASWLTGIATDVQVLRWSLPLLGVALFMAAPVVWAVAVRTGTWQVRRPVGATAPAETS